MSRVACKSTLLLCLWLLLTACPGTPAGDPCSGDPCGIHGTCDATSGLCECDAIWAGEACDRCATGYSPEGETCVDLDECETETHDCDTHAACANTTGGWLCHCDPGWLGDGQQCQDVNECTEGLESCHADATCLNEPGAYACVCGPSFFGDGFACLPIPVNCGDGNLDPGEQCDDGANVDDDGCSAGCFSEFSGSADSLVDAPGDTGEGLTNAANAVNGVRGCGGGCGGADTFSLGYSPGADNYLVIGWNGYCVGNGPGTDFVVFENAFVFGGGAGTFMDQLIVYLSRDGTDWVSYPHDYVASDETVYSTDSTLWLGFAGVQPVRYHEEDNPVDPFNPSAAGGDHFDLEALPDDGGLAAQIKLDGFCYLKLVTAPSETNPDTGAPYVKDPISNGADIDGVIARYLLAE